MILRSEGNQLFLDNTEVRESASHRDSGPAHSQKISCVGSSSTGARIVSADEAGQLKVWDPSREKMSQRVWCGSDFKEACAVSVSENGRRLAVAVGLVVTIYDLEVHPPAKKLESAQMPLSEKVTFLQFTDDDHVMCSDSTGKKVIFERDPAWKVKPVKE